MTEIQMIGIIILKIWWLIIPLGVGVAYGIRQDRKEDEEWNTQ